MEQKIIKPGNKLIAEFMGNYVDVESYNAPVVDEPDGNYYYLHECKYHTSWDWLMPVVEKIENSYEMEIDSTFCQIILNDGEGHCTGEIKKDADTKIEAVWLAVVEFIKWYNGFRNGN